MLYAIVLIAIVLLSLLIVRIGSVALRVTGLDAETASFQALSAFTGTGFTTSEADLITKHPGRRKTVKILIIMGNAYFAAVVAMVIGAVFSGPEHNTVLETILMVGLILVGLILAIWIGLNRRLGRFLDHYIEGRLARSGGYRVYQLQRVLDLAGGYTVGEFRVRRGSWLAGKTLAELELASMNILVLAIERGLRLLRTPGGPTVIEENDNLVVYGPVDGMRVLVEGPKGDHLDAEEPANPKGPPSSARIKIVK